MKEYRKMVPKCGRGSFGRFRALEWVYFCKSIETNKTNTNAKCGRGSFAGLMGVRVGVATLVNLLAFSW